MNNNIIFFLVLASFYSCNKTTSEVAPVDIYISEMNLLNSSTISVQVQINSQTNISSAYFGVCFGLSSNPTIEDNVVTPDNNSLNFYLEIENLLPNTTYFGRGFFSKSSHTNYSLNFSFTTQRAGVGEFKEGGVVFWVDPVDPNHGLVYSLELTNKKWGSQGVYIDGTNTIVGSGEQNTLLITENDPYYGAAAYCDALVTGGYDDWFLPSIDELRIIYAYRNIIRESMLQNVGTYQSSNYYWSSSQFNASYAWYLIFGNEAEVVSNLKDYNIAVKPIRAY
jgi:hypothetical protein